ncbi:MAG: amidohydrolase family protein [Acidimicrobiales bacterium]
MTRSPTNDQDVAADYLLLGTIITMDQQRRVISNGAVAVRGDVIVAVGTEAALKADYPSAKRVGSATDLVTPGYLNGHQHLTGDRLIQSSIPDDLAPGESVFSWAVPVHAVHTGDDDELSATLTLAEALSNGVTSTWEAGTVAHPERVAEAAAKVGARVTIGTWGWDVEQGPFAGSVDEVMARQQRCLDVGGSPLVSTWVSLVGHDLMSDELVVAAADLARMADTGLTFHLSPSTSDPESYLARTGRRPLAHMADLGVLDERVVIAHAVHIDDEEIDILIDTGSAVVSCPWAYLRLGQGVTRDFRHLDIWRRGGRLALGCDSENAGDMVDGLRVASLFAGLAKDVPSDPTGFGAHQAMELLTIAGAEALGVSDRVGSIEVAKQADLVVHDRKLINWVPHSDDPVLQLVWGSDGRSVRDVFVAGRKVVANHEVVGVDLSELSEQALIAGGSLLQRAGVSTAPVWPAHGSASEQR